MLFLRMAARLLFLRTREIEKIKDFLINNLGGRIRKFDQSLDDSTENSTIVFLTDRECETTDVDHAKYIILVKEPTSILLTALLNSSLGRHINRAELGPACLIMRFAGDEERVVNRLKKCYNGESISWKDGIKKGGQNTTLLALTSKAIGKKLTGKDFVGEALLLNQPIDQVQNRLRAEGIVFITQSMEEGQWYEYRINIYDSKGRYSQHYKRLMMVLNELELGMVLGETWTRDHALILYSVLAYQIRLFTLSPPEKMKKILLALEYNEAGERLVDLDLYYRNKKVSWVDIDRNKGRKRPDKLDQCRDYRQELFQKLSQATVENLLEEEDKLREKNN